MRTLPSGTCIKLFAAPWFVAAKLQAYQGRGNADVLGSNDIEDIIALLDGREELAEEMRQAPLALRGFVSEQLSALLLVRAFHDVIQGTAQDPDRETLIHERLNAVIEHGAHA
ncbi:MAG: hypothetical protein GAK37_02803 [Pseudomonas sp.]|nr:MAG: hypothetical protein GAK37_02803 [Pseudomonas sp.]